MKQHERTHKNGKNSATTSPVATSVQHFHKISESNGVSKPQANGRPRIVSGRSEEEDGEGESPGLDALATVANMEFREVIA